MSGARAKTLILVVILFAAGGVAVTLRAVFYPFVRIVTHTEDRCFPGYTLFAPGTDDLGYAREKVSNIYLIDMDGEVVHSWNVLDAVQVVKLKPDGNLVYSTRDRSFKKRAGIREIDPMGNVLWYFPCWADHDFSILENGNVVVHYIEDVEAPAIGPGEIRCPRIVEVNREREVLWEWKGEEHVDDLTALVGIGFPLDKEGMRLFDWAHNNTCQVIEDNDLAQEDARFRPGNIVISYCNLNTIGVIDRDSGDIVWAWGPGELDGQHNPQMMPNGHMLVFDNGTVRGYSRVIELDPVSKEIVWEYDDRDAERRFYSPYLSGAQWLPNENVLVCQATWTRYDVDGLAYRVFYNLVRSEPLSTRIFEVDRAGEIVWECQVTGHGDGKQGAYQATRYSASELRALFDALEALEGDTTRRLRSLPYVR